MPTDFNEVVRAVIDDRHGALIALAIHDRDPEEAQRWLDEHRNLGPHTLAGCPMRFGTGVNVEEEANDGK